MHNICIKFQENIFNGFRVIQRKTCIGKFTKGNNSVKDVGGVIVLVLCTLSDNALYLSQVSHLGMFVTTGCSSRRQFVATASRQDTGSRQQNTDSGR